MRDEVRGSSEYMVTGHERYLQMKATHRSNQYSLIMLQSSTPRPFISLITSMVSQTRRVTVRETLEGQETHGCPQPLIHLMFFNEMKRKTKRNLSE